eukprot:scaffold229626_cov73-Attheya_sp.AAC.3
MEPVQGVPNILGKPGIKFGFVTRVVTQESAGYKRRTYFRDNLEFRECDDMHILRLCPQKPGRMHQGQGEGRWDRHPHVTGRASIIKKNIVKDEKLHRRSPTGCCFS